MEYKEDIVKNSVPARCWYYLLEFNDRDRWETMHEMFGVIKLHSLTQEQFWKLFRRATEIDAHDGY